MAPAHSFQEIAADFYSKLLAGLEMAATANLVGACCVKGLR